MTFMELAKKRYSERYFDARPVEEEKIDRILEAGQTAPTACNYQPQRIYVIKSEEALKKLRSISCLTSTLRSSCLCAMTRRLPGGILQIAGMTITARASRMQLLWHQR